MQEKAIGTVWGGSTQFTCYSKLRLLLAAATAGSSGFEAKRTLLIVHDDEWDLRVTPKQKFGGQSLRVVHGTESPGPSPHASPNAYNNILYVLPPF